MQRLLSLWQLISFLLIVLSNCNVVTLNNILYKRDFLEVLLVLYYSVMLEFGIVGVPN